MPIFNVGGTNYQYPNVGDKPWGTIHIAWAAAVSSYVTSVGVQVATIQSNLFVNPMTTDGDMVYQASSVPTRLPVGNDGDQLTVVSGAPAWQTPGASVVPIGTILPWYDFGSLTLPTGFVYCDGSVITTIGSPIIGLTTPDLSGAYMGGFGSLGAGDIGTAAFTATPIGNANHEIAFNHTHTMAHTHNGPSHSHTEGTLKALIGMNTGASTIGVTRAGTGTTGTDTWATGGIGQNTVNNTTNYDVAIDGTTATSGTGATSGASTSTTSSSLSATQNIQPLTYQVRYIMKVL